MCGVTKSPRTATCRAYNIFVAEYFQPYADRITPAAAIPMHTPEEAVAELERPAPPSAEIPFQKGRPHA